MSQTNQTNPPVVISLLAEQWNIVLEALSNAPFRVAAPIIQTIQQQAQNYAMAQQARGEAVDQLGGEVLADSPQTSVLLNGAAP